MGMKTFCPFCQGSGKCWQESPPDLQVSTKGLSCEPPKRLRWKDTCGNCFGVGFTHEPIEHDRCAD